MRFYVTLLVQNAPFRRVRFSSPAQTSACLTEKHILCPLPHGKAQSAPSAAVLDDSPRDGVLPGVLSDVVPSHLVR